MISLFYSVLLDSWRYVKTIDPDIKIEVSLCLCDIQGCTEFSCD